MRYTVARYNENQREVAYRIYVTDSLKALTGSSARYADFLENKPVDNRSGKEIADDIIKRAGIEVIKR